MTINMEQILAMDICKSMYSLAGNKGLDRFVNSITIMDTINVSRWIKGGEIIICDYSIIKNDSSLFIHIINKVYEKGAASIFIKFNNSDGSLPKEVILEADRLKFPIILIPNNLSFAEIINPILNKILTKNNALLKLSYNIHNKFTKIVSDGGDISSILKTLNKITGYNFVYYDMVFNQKYIFDNKNNISSNPLEIYEENFDNMFKCFMCHELKDNNKFIGYLFCLDNPSDCSNLESKENISYLKVSMEHAATVIKLFIQKKRSNREIESRYRNEFVQDLITQNIKYPEEIYRRSEVYGWTMNNKRTAFIVNINDYKKEYKKISNTNKHVYYNLENVRDNIFKSIKDIIENSLCGTVFASFSDHIVFLVEYNKKISLEENYAKLQTIAENIKKNISDNFSFQVNIGIGTYRNPILNIHKSYEEAKKTIKIMEITNTLSTITFYKDLGIYELLAEISSSQNVIDFSKKTLDPLLKYDIANNYCLMETLYNIAECDWNLKKTSETMFLHYNTIKYRYKKIQEILGEDFKNPNTKLKFLISIKLNQIIS